MILWFIVGLIVWTLCILLMLAVFHGGHRNREHGCEQKLYSRYMVNPQNISYQELTDEEVLTLADKAGTFDFLNDPGEDIYNPSEVIEVRNIPLAQIKKEVLSLLSDGKTKYIDEIAEGLNLDFMDVIDAFNQLQEEGKLFIDENKLQI